MRIVILGCKGFIGKSLTMCFSEIYNEWRKEKYCITGLSHSELDLFNERAVIEYFSEHKYDVVIHTAVWYPSHAGKIEDIRRGVEMNLRMFINVARCSDHFGRMIYFGSGAEYDKTKDIVNVTEEELEGGEYGKWDFPSTEYGFAKRVIGQLIENSENIYNLRLFGLYGKYEDYRTKFITGCCAKAVLGLPITIRQNVYFDYLYIDDFCRMVDRFIQLDKPKHHTYNVVTGQKIDLLTLAECVRDVSGKDIPIFVCNEDLGNEYTANGDRLQNEIDYHEFVPYRETIAELLEYFEERKDELDMGALLYQG